MSNFPLDSLNNKTRDENRIDKLFAIVGIAHLPSIRLVEGTNDAGIQQRYRLWTRLWQRPCRTDRFELKLHGAHALFAFEQDHLASVRRSDHHVGQRWTGEVYS